MTTDNSRGKQQANVRMSHTLRLATAVAIGSSVTVGLSLYLFLGPIYGIAGTQTPCAYTKIIFFLLPQILTFAERSSKLAGTRQTKTGFLHAGLHEEPSFSSFLDYVLKPRFHSSRD